jgi:AbrB family looped-hinge helix DNA binding protein
MAADDGTLRTTLSTKGQIIVPKEIRARRHWIAGTRFVIEETPDGVLLRPETRFPVTRPEDVFGCLGRSERTTTVEEMDEAVAAEFRRQDALDRY